MVIFWVLGGTLVIFWVSKVFWSFLGFDGIFGHFLDLEGILVIFWVFGVFWSFLRFWGYFGHFLGFRGYFGNF